MLALVSTIGAQEPTGLEIAERYRVAGLEDRRFDHETLWRVLAPFLEHEDLRVEEIGRSVQGRLLRAIHFGEGPTRVLLWSQMHGDEATATMALVDILRFLTEAEGAPLRERLRSSLTLTMVPMLNPDGAEVFRRRNAIGVDINRDARRLATPEARALKNLRDRIRPDFGFNLHDQQARTLAGEEGEQVGIALLAPAADEERSYGEVRRRARLVAAAIAEVLRGEIGGQVAKYDDTFEPRAFGDLMQSWGTSTVLIESGALAGDPQKQRLRAINVLALLRALDAIGSGSYREASVSEYEDLPENESIEHDVLLVGGKLLYGDGEPVRVDVGIWFEDPVARQGARLGDVGDLEDEPALEIVDVSGLLLDVKTYSAEGTPTERLEHGAYVVVEVRRNPSRGEVVRRIGTRP